MTKRKQQWILYGRQTQKQLFFYEDRVLDLTHFMNEHPGGKKALVNYVYKDITDILFNVYPHKKQTTLGTLFACTIGRLSAIDVKNSKQERQSTPTKDKEKKKVCFAKRTLDQSQAIAVKALTSITNENIDKGGEDNIKKKKQKTGSRSKSKQKSHKSKDRKAKQQPVISPRQSFTVSSDDFDEQKPSFKVPVLSIRLMNNFT